MDKVRILQLLALVPDQAQHVSFQYNMVWFSMPKDWEPSDGRCMPAQEIIWPRTRRRWKID